ncbi:MaoC family dehydratase [Pseudooceanicola aestuarii]|uniref:MaoC family dehydratase n=1 Tax=Pseudooceanicola aestuarii TaxID=2697319 RepID=UPI0013D838C5|nr:MaoC family dehydratase [Pseudooceanicola aestuarii]
MYFDDLQTGYRFDTAAEGLTEDAILSFARAHDPQPFHTDPEAAKTSIYGGLIASGLQTMAISLRQTLETGVFSDSSLGSPGMDRVRWLRPVRPGDSLQTRGTVASVTPSRSKPDRGAVVIDYEVVNQAAEVVCSYSTTHMLARRPVG